MKTIRLASLAILALAFSMPADLHAQQQGNDRKTAPATPSKSADARGNLELGTMRILGRVQVGALAPDFTATSTSGKTIRVSRLRGDWIVLVFAENREDFRALRQVHESLAQIGAVVYGVCKDKPQRLRAVAERDSLAFELLADDTGDVSAVYGLYDLERRATSPGFVVVDRFGVVRMALQGLAPPPQVAELTRFTIAGD